MLFKKKIKYGWSGNYESWEQVLSQCDGYDNETVYNKVYQTTLDVINNKYAYERDSIGFNDNQLNLPLLYLLQRSLIENGNCKVLDFGGALGSLFFQHKKHLNNFNHIQWTVVEQDKFVKLGNCLPHTHNLNFEENIETALSTNPNVLILSSVLQYLEQPESIIKRLLAHPFQYVFLDRTAFVNADNHVLTLQIVPPHIYKASYPSWFFNESLLLQQFNSYKIFSTFNNGIEPDIKLNDTTAYWKGFILIK